MTKQDIIMLSIIIPHYNTPDLLNRLLFSIPDIPQIEVIVIDDNSTLGIDIYNKCKEINKNRNVSFYQNDIKKPGAGNARNVGLKYANGEWVTFADADDYYVEGFWDIISAHLNDNCDVVFFSSTSIKLDTNEESDRHVHYANLVKKFCDDPTHENEIKLRCTFWSPCSKIIRRKFIEKNRIKFDGTKHSNDMMFSTKVGLNAGVIEADKKVIYCITESNNSLTSSKRKKDLRTRADVFCNYYFYLNSHLSRDEMKILGYSLKDYIYFVLYRMHIIQIRDFILKRDI